MENFRELIKRRRQVMPAPVVSGDMLFVPNSSGGWLTMPAQSAQTYMRMVKPRPAPQELRRGSIFRPESLLSKKVTAIPNTSGGWLTVPTKAVKAFDKGKLPYPEYKEGGKVKKTGLALVHKNEVVVPAQRVATVDKALKKAGLKPLKK